ncbi:MAG: BrnA antitoxin family protein [Xanthobacteraceae bacterium]|jgi:uncharacterized protein (DUF4415 family)|nr:BrnA antitoxin family protein [Xanthobacteraceae bacterium]
MKNSRTITLSQLKRARGKTDWKRVRSLSDDAINNSIASDEDWQDFKEVDWSRAEVVVPVKKEPISIRLDVDVLEFFRKDGEGYQRRINAVLRSFVNEVTRHNRSATKGKKRA